MSSVEPVTPQKTTVTCPQCGGPAQSRHDGVFQGKTLPLFECVASPRCMHYLINSGGRTRVLEFVIADGQKVLVQPGGDHD
jgi:hypothetical protein